VKQLFVMSALLLSLAIVTASTGEMTSDSGSISEFSDPAELITLVPGQKFFLVLESNRTTGYRWELSTPKKSPAVRFVENTYSEPQTTRVGAGGKEVWTFEALFPGKTEITLNYVRRWEKKTPPVKTVTFHIHVGK
jgi:predicted secreted protein